MTRQVSMHAMQLAAGVGIAVRRGDLVLVLSQQGEPVAAHAAVQVQGLPVEQFHAVEVDIAVGAARVALQQYVVWRL